MPAVEHINGLSECIGRAIQEHLRSSNINIEWPHIDSLTHPVLRIEAFLEDKDETQSEKPKRSERVALRTLDLTGIITPAPSSSLTANLPGHDIVSLTGEHSSHENLEPAEDEEMNTASTLDHPPATGVSGLRISNHQTFQEDLSEHQRQMQADTRRMSKRRKLETDNFVFQPSTLDKLIIGIWEQIHGSLNLDPKAIFEQFQIVPPGNADMIPQRTPAHIVAMEGVSDPGHPCTSDSFNRVNIFCRKVTQASRVCRSIEIIVQAWWTELFEEQVQLRIAAKPELSTTKHRKSVLMEACQDFGWSEKELRNKMTIWRGYKEVKDAAGWAALVFAGMGIYRFCKYRVGFDSNAMKQLRNMRKRFEVAADTLHPNWRQLLTIVGETQRPQYNGHPHDWVVFEDGSDPVPLRHTYLPSDPFFDFENIDESMIDDTVWGCEDPRWVPETNAIARNKSTYICASCGEQQSDDPIVNLCYCFPQLFGCVKRKPPLVQVYRTRDGRNNGLIALTSFDRGAAIGEFVGLVTKGVRHVDVMDSSTSLSNYQIWQGRVGNYTRFVNHSCRANAQFSTFTWTGTQRIILVSKGVEAGAELFVDYGDKYWAGLDKACLCGESCCRYRERR